MLWDFPLFVCENGGWIIQEWYTDHVWVFVNVISDI